MSNMQKPKVDVTKLADNDFKQDIEWEDKNHEKHVIHAVFRDPGYDKAMDTKAKMNIGNNEADYGELINLLLNNFIVSPRLSYSDLDNKVPAELKIKTLKLDGKHGKHFEVKAVFPGYRSALNFTQDIRGVNGSDNQLAILKSMNEKVFRDSNNKPLTMDFWNQKGGGVGAIFAALTYFSDVTDRNGFQDVIKEAITFLFECLQ